MASEDFVARTFTSEASSLDTVNGATIAVEGTTLRPDVSIEARKYAVKELARRAGVDRESFQSWRISANEKETTVWIGNSSKRIRFRNLTAQQLDRTMNGKSGVTTATWMEPAPYFARLHVPNFIVPFSAGESGYRPLFQAVDQDCFECPFDLPASALFTLSRFEETLPGDRDRHGRFPAAASIGSRHGFLRRPIVDEYGLALEQVLAALVPGYVAHRQFRVSVSHDVDEVGLPFRLITACGHTLRRHHPLATVRDLLYPITGLSPTYLRLVQDVVSMSLTHGLRSTVYWKASRRGKFDSGYNPSHPAITRILGWLRDRGVEMGLHAGYETYLRPDRLLQEAKTLAEALGEWPLGGRAHYLRWQPETWADWEACNLSYDTSLGCADETAFRAGTCYPYRPWLLSQDREASIIELPLVVMDATLVSYLKMTPEQSMQRVSECLARCQVVGGVFTLLWHNAILIDPRYEGFYDQILNLLAGNESLDVRALARYVY
jgi:hypothetical protein